jgi:hypothetical protein
MNIKLIGAGIVVVMIIVMALLATFTNTFGNNPPPIDGGWSEYEYLSGECSKECGDGLVEKTRTCTNPKPKHNGKDCQGTSKLVEDCKLKECPVDGGWSTEWNNVGECSKDCRGGGIMKQERLCNNPSPAYLGKECAGNKYRDVPCNEDVPCGVMTRYVSWGGKSYQNLQQIEVFTADGKNVALNKSVTSSSNLNSHTSSRHLVDGNTGTLAHTKGDSWAWWTIDLGDEYDITKIRVYNRTYCCQERLNGGKLSLYNATNKKPINESPNFSGSRLIYEYIPKTKKLTVLK